MKDTIYRQDAIDALMDEFKRTPTMAIRAKHVIGRMPYAQPERPKGKWIWELDEGDPSRSMMLVCSICGSRRDELGTYNFCHICGAKMINARGEQDE